MPINADGIYRLLPVFAALLCDHRAAINRLDALVRMSPKPAATNVATGIAPECGQEITDNAL